MSQAQWLGVGVCALLMFWVIGAYNRLVAMRTAIGAVYAQVDDLIQRRAAAAHALAAATHDEMIGEHSAIEAWLAAQDQCRQAADALRARPVLASLAAALVAAEAPLAAAGARVMALLEQRPRVLGDNSATTHVATLRETEARLVFARQMFNEAAQTYNDAVRLFPTRLLARAFDFGTAGRL